LQEDWIFRDQSREARAIRQGLGWTARNEELAIIDNSAITTGRTYDDLLQFVCSYRLVDVLVQYERLHGDNRSIPKNPAIPGSAKIKVRLILMLLTKIHSRKIALEEIGRYSGSSADSKDASTQSESHESSGFKFAASAHPHTASTTDCGGTNADK